MPARGTSFDQRYSSQRDAAHWFRRMARGVGRWKTGIHLLRFVADGSSCDDAAVGAPWLMAPVASSDLDLIRARSWFTDYGMPVGLTDTQNDAPYDIDHVGSVIDIAQAFGATPYMCIDLVPLALSTGGT